MLLQRSFVPLKDRFQAVPDCCSITSRRHWAAQAEAQLSADAKPPIAAADKPQRCGEKPQAARQEGSAEARSDRAQWIVRFNSYRMAADHEASITASLGALSLELNASAAETGTCPGSSCSAGSIGENPSCSGGGSGSIGSSSGRCAAQQPWHWVRRRNKAAAHPTDFGLLSCAPAVAGVVKVHSFCRL